MHSMPLVALYNCHLVEASIAPVPISFQGLQNYAHVYLTIWTP